MGLGDDDKYFGEYSYSRSQNYESLQRNQSYGRSSTSGRHVGGGSGGSRTSSTTPPAKHANAPQFDRYASFREIREKAGFKTQKELVKKLVENESVLSLKIKLDGRHCGYFVRDLSIRNIVLYEAPQPLPLEQPKAPAEKGAVRLEDISDEDLLAEFERRKKLKPAFVKALNAATSADTPLPMPLPTVAPKLRADRPPNAKVAQYSIEADTPFWKDRDATDPRNPVEFIKGHYGKMKRDGTWDNAGLTRPQLKRDAQLYAAYATWISRHPNDALTFAPGRNAGRYERIDDPQEFMERRRASEAESRRKAKVGRREDTPEPG